MKIDCPTPASVPALRQLWKAAFGDTEGFLDCFFDTAFSPHRCRCVTVDGEIAAALYWFDVTCREQPMAYIYAVATAPAWREQGYCRALMEDTHRHLAALGYAGALLVPDGNALSRMYAGLGYKPCTTVSELVCAASEDPAPMHRIDREEYARLRRRLLPPGGVIQEGENLAFLERQATFYAGLGFLLAAFPEDDTLVGLELLGNAAEAPGILMALGLAYGRFRIPGGDEPFAMFLPLSPEAEAPGYFGLAFD